MDARETDADRAVGAEESEQLRRALDEERQRNLRLLADFENFRRRAAREQEMARREGRRAALLPLLPVLDTLERALAAGSTDPDFYEGVAATQRLFMSGPARGRGGAGRERRATVRPQRPRGGGHGGGERRRTRDRRAGGAARLAARRRAAPPGPGRGRRRPRRQPIGGGEVSRLLRGAGRPAHGVGQGHQARLPRAGAQAPSRSPARRRAPPGRRAVQGDQRGPRSPERPRQARQVRRPRRELEGRDGLHAAARGPSGAPRMPGSGRTRGGSATSSPRSSGSVPDAGDRDACGSPSRAATSRPSCR